MLMVMLSKVFYQDYRGRCQWDMMLSSLRSCSLMVLAFSPHIITLQEMVYLHVARWIG
jgi:hypothetical protein